MDAKDPRASQFRRAVETSDAAALKYAFTEHPELTGVIDEPWFSFESPALVYAARANNRDVLDALFELGADPTAKSSWGAGGYSALHKIIDGPAPVDAELAAYLIDRGVPVDLHAAAGLGRMDLLAQYLDADPDRVSEPGPDGATPLHLAADVDVAAFLLDRGADIDKRCVDHNSTPAMWSVQGREQVTRFLVEKGARSDLYMAAVLDDVEMARDILEREPTAIGVRVRAGESVDHLGGGDKYVWALDFADTPLEVARRRGNAAIYGFLLERSAPPARLLQACRRGDVEDIGAIFAAHPDVLASLSADAVCDLLRAPAAAIQEMLARGADPDALDDDNGATALHHAAWKGDLERVVVLIEHGADPNIRDRTYLSTPVGWAHENGQMDLVAHLAERVELDIVDAAWLGLVGRVREILDADPGLVDGPEEGRISPLRGAAYMGEVDVVKLLLARGAAPSVPSPTTGMTALEMATAQGYESVAELLRSAE